MTRPRHATAVSAKLDPSALTVTQASQLLTRVCGREVTEQMVRTDIEAGAPTNPDGSINLARYAAWSTRELVTTCDD